MSRLLNFLTCAIIVMMMNSCNKDSSPVVTPDPPDPDPPVFVLPQTSEIIMYEINTRAFGPGSDFQAVISRLDEIKKLKVNVIWLMPVHPIGEINSVNSPYSVEDYKKINPEFGNIDDFKLLVEEAHKRNIAVIMDWVANHTAWDNPWIENKSWYTQDGSGNIIHPPGTNWLDVADLNFDNMDMRSNMIDAMQFWIDETNIDGFRCDAADMVPLDFWSQALSSLNENTERSLILLAEGARKDHLSAGFQMIYGWNFYSSIKQVFSTELLPKMLNVMHISEYAGMPDGSRRLRFTTNHDESAWDATPIQLFGGVQGALSASVISTFMGGTPLIYGSQEVGEANTIPFFSPSTIDWTQNPQMLAEYKLMNTFFQESNTARQSDLVYIEHGQVVAFMKFSSEGKMLVLAHTREQEVTFAVPDSLQDISWTNVMSGQNYELPENLILSDYNYLILNSNSK